MLIIYTYAVVCTCAAVYIHMLYTINHNALLTDIVVGVEEDAGLEYSSTPLANIADLYTYWSTQDTPWDKGDNLTNLSTDSGIIKPSTV